MIGSVNTVQSPQMEADNRKFDAPAEGSAAHDQPDGVHRHATSEDDIENPTNGDGQAESTTTQDPAIVTDNLGASLDRARRELLDLSTRNRLLNMPRRRSNIRSVEVVDEVTTEVFRILVREGRTMTFIAGKEQDETTIEIEQRDEEDGFGHLLEQPDDEPEDLDSTDIPRRHTDNQLQSAMPGDKLQKRLLQIYYDARTFEEEQGVNILYIALGFLKWFDRNDPNKARYAPLLLIPVELERKSANTKFRIRYSEDEIATNLSLQAKLRQDFDLDLPDVPDIEDLDPAAYFAEVKQAVIDIVRWEVLPNDMVLSFFSFSKFLMYRDLDAAAWPHNNGMQLTDHPLLTSLVSRKGFDAGPDVFDDSERLDEVLQPEDLVHVMNADSSQATAIERVRRGQNLVIQGPPGTGKSQTIANLIGAAVKEGKKVLFVAEKMAALEVVKRRLDNIGLGDMCLELHSHKANKRTVLAELERTLNLGSPQTGRVKEHFHRLREVRDRLNRHAETMHERLEPSMLTPYRVIGELVSLRHRNIPPADFTLDNCVQWSPADRKERLRIVNDVIERIRHIGTPAQHPFRGVMLDAMLPMDQQRWRERLPDVAALLDDVIAANHELAERMTLHPAEHFSAMREHIALAERINAMPPCDRAALGHDAWTTRTTDLADIFETATILNSTHQQLDPLISDAAWDTDVANTRRDLAAHGRSFFRYLNGAYRRAKAEFRGLLKQQPPSTLDEWLNVLDLLIKAQKARKELERLSETGTAAFGSAWRGERSDFVALAATVSWNEQNGDNAATLRRIAAQSAEPAAIAQASRALQQAINEASPEVTALLDAVKLSTEEAFLSESLEDTPISDLCKRIDAWTHNAERIDQWIQYRLQRDALESLGGGQLAERINDGRIAPQDAIDRYHMAHFEAVMRAMAQKHPHLAQFDGQMHEKLLDEFRTLDQQRIELARQEVAKAHYVNMPKGGGEVGQVGLIRREFQKKRRHLPIRRLLAEAGDALQRIKPVFMMSPMSVAQFLEPGAARFDLLLIDEASQVRPVDALGAIARCERVVVVGDDKQLPPTRFFHTVIGEDDEAADDDFFAGDMESILGLCVAQGLPQTMLRWHYRSKHPSLIEVSNREFYDNQLVVIPSPYTKPRELGLRFHHIADGVFDRGGSATNRIEAKAVARAVMQHAREHPELTLGVGAFSVSQRDAIIDELELLQREDQSSTDFFATDVDEPFFVKNLENIQGDERDVIFISVGYGRDQQGRMSMNFGPLSNEGGERRLNVLITRARRRLELYSSITGADIDISRVSQRGPRAFKTFLDFASHPTFQRKQIADDDDSRVPFDDSVVTALEEQGLTVARGVGSTSFFIDVAVMSNGDEQLADYNEVENDGHDGDGTSRCLLGIECDGPGYHAAAWARDRDRIRPSVLANHGWHMHRIWSTDWFRRPHEQLERVMAAVNQAKAGISGPGDAVTARTAGKSAAEIIRSESGGESLDRTAGIPTEPYREASFTPPRGKAITDHTAAGLGKFVRRIVDTEGPVHQEEVTRRLAQLWDTRTGSRIKQSIDEAMMHEVSRGRIVIEDGYCFPAGPQHVRVRDRSHVRDSLRAADMLPPMEIRWALLGVVAAQIGVSADEAITETARLLGFASTRDALRDTISPQLEALKHLGELEEKDGRLFVKSGTA